MIIPKVFKVTAQDAYNYAASKGFTDQQLCMVLIFNGKLDEIALAKTVRLTLDLEPVLGCRIEGNDGNLIWFRRNDLDKLQLCTLVETTNVEQELMDFINTPILANRDPLVSARIFRKNSSDTFCLKLSHAAGDAGGLKVLTARLSDVYSSLLNGKEVSVLPNLGRRDQSQLFEYTKDSHSFQMTALPSPTWMLPQTEGTKPLHVFRQIGKIEFDGAKRFAKRSHSTINDLLLAALFRGLFKANNIVEGKPMLIQVSIDLRRYLPDCKAEAVCNLSGALYVSLERKLGERFEQTLLRVSELMHKLKQDYPGVESAAGLEYLFNQGFAGMEKYMMRSAELGKKFHVTFPLLSNFGIIDQYHFGILEILKGYISSPVMYYPGFMLGVSTFNGEMTLSIGYCGQENTKQINKFLDSFIDELTK